MDQLLTYADQLRDLEAMDRKRQLALPSGRDFSSNDYLGLAGSAFLRERARSALEAGIPHGSGGSRLLGGNHGAHEELEAFAACHYGAEAALFFGSGFAANSALFATLPQTGDLVLYDALVHASVHDGMKLGHAAHRSFRHGDCGDLEEKISEWRHAGGKGTPWIAVESLYSMDGDIAPLDELAALADRHEAMLIIDEAHAVGVFGERGRGLSGDFGRRENVLVLRTCGKALGVEGGIITMAAVLRDFFINRARAFIFSTAPSPLTAHLVQQAIGHVEQRRQLREELAVMVGETERALAGLCPTRDEGTQIFPVIIGDDRQAVMIAARLQRQGFDVRAIRPPTVPTGSARLRISLTLNVGKQDIHDLASALEDAMKLAEAA